VNKDYTKADRQIGEVAMLVLSRRQEQTVRFPNLGIEVHVVKTGAKVVRLGVAAPPDVLVLRGELPQPSEFDAPAAVSQCGDSLSRFRHDIRDRLNVASLGLQVLQQRINTGKLDDLEPLIDRMLKALQTINDELASGVERQPKRSIESPFVLIVEDNANEGQLLSEVLASHGCRTALVGNGRQAIHHLRQHGRPDFVLLDMNMPELDGPATIRAIREQSEYDGLVIYGVSGLEREETQVLLGPDGVDAWFTKPVNVRRLMEEVLSTNRDSNQAV